MGEQRKHAIASKPCATIGRGANAQSKLAERMWIAALADSVLLSELGVSLLSEPRLDPRDRAIALWLQHHHIFALDLVDFGVRYPAFQFQFDGTPWPVLAAVLPQLQLAFEPRDLMIWFNAPHPTLRLDKPRARLDQFALIVSAVNVTLKPIDFY
jgi:hypothetical protein